MYHHRLFFYITTKMLFGVACATSSIFYPNDRYKDTPSPFIYDKTKKNTKCLTYLKNHREPMPFYLPGLHSRIYKNHRHKMIRHTKLIDHILRLPSLDATLQSYQINHQMEISRSLILQFANSTNVKNLISKSDVYQHAWKYWI